MLGDLVMDDETMQQMLDQTDQMLNSGSEVFQPSPHHKQNNNNNRNKTPTVEQQVKEEESEDAFDRPRLKVMDLKVTLIDDSKIPNTVAPNQKYEMKIKVHMAAASELTYQVRVCRPEDGPGDEALEHVEMCQMTVVPPPGFNRVNVYTRKLHKGPVVFEIYIMHKITPTIMFMARVRSHPFTVYDVKNDTSLDQLMSEIEKTGSSKTQQNNKNSGSKKSKKKKQKQQPQNKSSQVIPTTTTTTTTAKASHVEPVKKHEEVEEQEENIFERAVEHILDEEEMEEFQTIVSSKQKPMKDHHVTTKFNKPFVKHNKSTKESIVLPTVTASAPAVEQDSASSSSSTASTTVETATTKTNTPWKTSKDEQSSAVESQQQRPKLATRTQSAIPSLSASHEFAMERRIENRINAKYQNLIRTLEHRIDVLAAENLATQQILGAQESQIQELIKYVNSLQLK